MIRSVVAALLFCAAVPLVACAPAPDANDASSPGIDAAFDGGTNDGGADDGGASDGGASDATTDDGGVPPDAAVPPESPELLAILDAYEHGGEVDFEGDGTVDVTIVALPDGTFEDTLVGAGGVVRQHTIWRGPSDYDLTGDQDLDGAIDHRVSSILTETEIRYVEERDDDLDGAFDHRLTQVTTIAGGRPVLVDSTTEETVRDGSWVTTGGYRSSDRMLACGGMPASRSSTERTCASDADCRTGEHCGDGHCNCWWDGLPATLAEANAIAEPIGGGGRLVALRSGPYACDDTQVGLLSIAVRAAEVTIDDPLRSIHDGLADRLYRSIARRRVVYGCANPVCADPDVVAITERNTARNLVVFDDDARGAITTIAPSIFTAGEIGVTEVVAHEWFHLDIGGHPDDPQGDLGRDYIYACSRFMTGCRGYSRGFYLGERVLASSARDAALCADLDHKSRFGLTEFALATDDYFWESAPGTTTGEALAWCRPDATTAPTAPCLCMLESTWTYCDQTPARPRDRTVMGGELDSPSCCRTCPASAPLAITACAPGEMPAARYARPPLGMCTDVGGCGY